MNLTNGDGRTQNILQERYCYHKQKRNVKEFTLNPQGSPVWKADNSKQHDINKMRNLTSRLSNTQ